VVAIVVLVFTLVIGIVYGVQDSVVAPGVSPFATAVISSMSFLFGAACSAVSGYIGMWIAVRTNVRAANAAAYTTSKEALVICLRCSTLSLSLFISSPIL
ncbi:pyrophosphate-energised proton pump, partial [Kipferlia bialata]